MKKIKYKFFYSTKDFELWQNANDCVEIMTIVPVPFSHVTTGIHDQLSGSVSTTTNPDYQIFVTYTEYNFMRDL